MLLSLIFVLIPLVTPFTSSASFTTNLRECEQKSSVLNDAVSVFVNATGNRPVDSLAHGRFVHRARELREECSKVTECLAELRQLSGNRRTVDYLNWKMSTWSLLCETFDFYGGKFAECFGKIVTVLKKTTDEECELTDSEWAEMNRVVRKKCGAGAAREMKENEYRVKRLHCSVTF